MGIKLAKALGNEVMAISSSNKKEALAREKGATLFASSRDPESMKVRVYSILKFQIQHSN